MSSTSAHISIRIDSDVLKAVEAEAKRRKWSRSATIQHLVEYGLPDSESDPVRTVLAKVNNPFDARDSIVVPQTHHPRCGCSICKPK